MSKTRLVNKSFGSLLFGSSLLGLFLTSCTVDVKHSNADVQKAFNEVKQDVKNLEENNKQLNQRVNTLEKGFEAKKAEEVAKKLEDEQKARLPQKLFNKTKELEIANNLAAESSTSFLHLQFARDSLVNAFKLLNDKQAVEQEIYEQEKLLDNKLLEYREARDYNYTGFSETLLYLVGFKWLWGAFTGYAATTFSQDQWEAYVAKKEETKDTLESLKQRVFVTNRTLQRELERVSKALDDATSTAISAAEQLKFKKLKRWVLKTFADRVAADEKFITARGVFRESMLAALNSPEVTLEERKQVVDFSKMTGGFLGLNKLDDKEVENLRALLESPTSFKLMEFAYTLDNFKEEKELYDAALSSFKTQTAGMDKYFEALFDTFKARQQLPLDLKRQIEALENKMKSWDLKAYELENNLDKANHAVESSKKDTEAAQRIFDKLVNVFELGEEAVTLFKKVQGLKAKLSSYEELEYVKNAEFDAQNNQTKGSFLREFAMYTLGFKWLTSSFSFLGQVFKGNGWNEAKKAFKFSDATPQAAQERAEFFDMLALEREATTQQYDLAKKDFEDQKFRVTQAIQEAQTSFDEFAKTRGFAYAATGRSTLQKVYAQLLKVFTDLEKADDVYYSNKRLFLTEFATTDGLTKGQERFRNDYGSDTFGNLAVGYSASNYLNHLGSQSLVVALQHREPNGNEEVVKDMYKNLNFSYFLNGFNQEKLRHHSRALLCNEWKFDEVRNSMLEFMATVANFYDSYLDRTRDLEQDLLNLTSKNAMVTQRAEAEEETEAAATTTEAAAEEEAPTQNTAENQ